MESRSGGDRLRRGVGRVSCGVVETEVACRGLLQPTKQEPPACAAVGGEFSGSFQVPLIDTRVFGK